MVFTSEFGARASFLSDPGARIDRELTLFKELYVLPRKEPDGAIGVISGSARSLLYDRMVYVSTRLDEPEWKRRFDELVFAGLVLGYTPEGYVPHYVDWPMDLGNIQSSLNGEPFFLWRANDNLNTRMCDVEQTIDDWFSLRTDLLHYPAGAGSPDYVHPHFLEIERTDGDSSRTRLTLYAHFPNGDFTPYDCSYEADFLFNDSGELVGCLDNCGGGEYDKVLNFIESEFDISRAQLYRYLSSSNLPDLHRRSILDMLFRLSSAGGDTYMNCVEHETDPAVVKYDELRPHFDSVQVTDVPPHNVRLLAPFSYFVDRIITRFSVGLTEFGMEYETGVRRLLKPEEGLFSTTAPDLDAKIKTLNSLGVPRGPPLKQLQYDMSHFYPVEATNWEVYSMHMERVPVDLVEAWNHPTITLEPEERVLL